MRQVRGKMLLLSLILLMPLLVSGRVTATWSDEVDAPILQPASASSPRKNRSALSPPPSEDYLAVVSDYMEDQSLLGADWINSADGGWEERTARHKRAAGTSAANSTVVLVEIASECISETAVDIGDSFSFQFQLDFGPITLDQQSDLSIEIFALQPQIGLSAFHICQSAVTSIGQDIDTLQVSPVYTEQIKAGYVNYVEKSLIEYEQLSTDGVMALGSLGVLTTQFDAVMMDTGEAVTNTDYYISAGASLASDGYVWITQEMLVTLLVTTTYDSNIELTVAPTSIAKGDSQMFLVSAYLTEPSAFLQFGVFQPLGYNDVFHIGQITYTLGDAFACSDPQYWVADYNPSPSGLSVYNASVNYPLLINREAQRDVTQDINRITFAVPVHVLNTDENAYGVDRHLAFELLTGPGGDTFWSAIQIVSILQYAAPTTVTQTPTFLNVTQINAFNNTANATWAGDSAVFSVEMLVHPGWTNFDTYVYGSEDLGIYAVGARIVSSGYVSYFPVDSVVSNVTGDNVTVSFGNVKNIANADTVVTMQIVFAVSDGASNMSVMDTDVSAYVGGVRITSLAFEVWANGPSAANMSVVLQPNHFGDSIFYVTGSIGIDLLVTVPSGAGTDSVLIEALPDASSTTFNTRLCRIKVWQVGAALPCVYFANTEDLETYSLSLPTRPWNDYGSINLPLLCPYDDLTGDATSNQFMISMYMDLPRQTGATPTTNTTGVSCLDVGYDYTGAASNNLPGSPSAGTTVAACQGLCQTTSGCGFWSYHGSAATPANSCYLRYDYPGKVLSANVTSGPKYCTSSYTLSTGITVDNETVFAGSSQYVVTGADFNYTSLTELNATNSNANQALGNPIPFVTTYPILTTFERANPAFSIKEGLFIQYMFKPQPATRGEYTFVVTPAANIKICLLTINAIGDNFPCAQVAGTTLTGYDNIWITYGVNGTNQHGCGAVATITFHGLTNWGTDPIIPDLTPDENGIQIAAYMQVCNSIAATNASVKYALTWAEGFTQNTTTEPFTIQLTNAQLPASTSSVITGTTYSSLIGPNNVIYKQTPQLMQILVNVPGGYLGNITVELANPLYDQNVAVDFCGAAVVAAGANVPCLNLQTDQTVTMGPSKIVNNQTIYQSMQLVIIGVCYVSVDQTVAASQITVEAAVRISDLLPDNTMVTLTLNVYPESPILVESQNMTLKVMTPNATSIATNTLTPGQALVYPSPNYTTNPISIKSGNSAWVQFLVSIPPSTTVPMQASFLMPNISGYPILYALDVKFWNTSGTNVLCTRDSINLKDMYNVTFGKTSNLGTFMPNDAVSINLGYVINSGFTVADNKYNTSGYDDTFGLAVLVQMSDNAVTTSAGSWPVYLSVSFGTMIVVANQVVYADRTSPRNQELPRLNVTAMTTINSTQILSKGDNIPVFVTINHLSTSHAEGYPTKIRVFLPDYLDFNGLAVYSNYTTNTNYTPGNLSYSVVQAAPNSSIFDVVFAMGILYPDYVQLNFNLTVDPYGVRQPGAANTVASVVVQPICVQNTFGGYPLLAANQRTCGNLTSVGVQIGTADCYNRIPFIANCQIRASSMISSSYAPSNVNTSTSVWAPAVSGGSTGQDYLEFDFLVPARINQIKIVGAGATTLLGQTFITASSVKIQAGNSLSSLSVVVASYSFTQGSTISLPSAVVVRYVRITILSVSNLDPSLYQLGMNDVEFYGCLPYGSPPQLASNCFPATTLDSSSAATYRHFAVDDGQEILYFCDYNSYVDAAFAGQQQQLMLCYSSNRTGAAAGAANAWQSLPTLARRIVGYSPSRGRMFLTDSSGASVISCIDGVTLDVSDLQLPTDIIPAVVVPGDVAANVGNQNWSGKLYTYKGTYTGLYKGSTALVQWTACCF